MKVLVSGTPKCVGGIGTIIENIAIYNAKVQKPMELCFLVQQDSVYTTRLIELGYPVYRVPRLLNIIAYYQAIKDIFKRNKFDIVWINNSSKIDIILPSLAHFYGAKNVMHSHGVDSEAHGVKKAVFTVIEKMLGKFYESLVDCPVACSVNAANHFYANEKNRHNCCILNNGIFVEKFLYDEMKRKKIRDELKIDEDTVLIGAVGRLTRVKNYTFVLKIAAQLTTTYQFIILGEGEDREQLTSEIEKLGISDRVRLLGKKNNVDEYLSAMDIYLMPSLHEGAPLSLIEAGVCGLPCIVSQNVNVDISSNDVIHASIDNANIWADQIMKQTKLDREKTENTFKDRVDIRNCYRTLRNIFDSTKNTV